MSKRSMAKLGILAGLAYVALGGGAVAAGGFSCASSQSDCQTCCDTAKSNCEAGGGQYDSGPLGCVYSPGSCAEGGCFKVWEM